MLKPITKSKITTQELEIIEKPNIFATEPVTTEHIKTVTKLLKIIETKTKITTQQPNKIKVYIESKSSLFFATIRIQYLRIKYLLTHGLIQKIYNLFKLPDNHATNFQQELKGGHMKDHVGLLIRYYNITLLFHKPIFAKEVVFFSITLRTKKSNKRID